MRSIVNKNINITFIVLILVGALSFFNLAIIPTQLIKAAQLGVLAFIVILLVIQIIYIRPKLLLQRFSPMIWLIMFSVGLSMLVSYGSHNQNLALTAYEQRPIYFYLFYFLLHHLHPNPKALEKIITTIGLFFAFAYLIQLIAFPRQLFDVPMRIDRGTLRIFLPGLGFMIVAYFMHFSKLLESFDIKKAALCLGFIMIAILQGTRQVLLPMILMTLYMIMIHRKMSSKLVILPLLLLMLVPVTILFQGVFEGMLKASEATQSIGSENVRLQAIKFFLTDFQTGTASYIFGNGAANQGSDYGLEILSYKMQYGYYLSDIGIFGEYTRYGILFIAGVFMILFRVFTSPYQSEYKYIKIFFIMVSITLVTGAGFSAMETICLFMILLYLIDFQYTDTTVNLQKKNLNL